MLFHIFNRVVHPFSEKIIIIHNQEYTKITLLFKTENNYCIITFVINFVINTQIVMSNYTKKTRHTYTTYRVHND